jgi:hypothetical protein
MPDDEETPPDSEEEALTRFLEDHVEDDTMTREEEEAIKKDNPGPVPQDVA